jgi:GNAT superfamily N-acetyltransferase
VDTVREEFRGGAPMPPALHVLGVAEARPWVERAAHETGVPCVGQFGTVAAVHERFLAQEPCDLVILPHAQALALGAQGRVVAGSSAELGVWRPPASPGAVGADAAPTPVLAVARASHASQGPKAADFMAWLAGDSARALRRAAGYEGVAIRPVATGGAAIAADAAAIRGLVRTVLSQMGLRREADADDDDLKNLAASYLSRGGTFDLAFDIQGAAVGCCGVYPLNGRRDSPVCELRKMALLPAWRGQGLGRRLLERALAFARGRGYVRIELDTASSLKEAIALYRRAGFCPLLRPHASTRCDLAFSLDLRPGSRPETGSQPG